MTKISSKEKEMFEFLNGLRDSGVTNMFGAAPYLVDEFNIPTVEARKVLTKWMENFRQDGDYRSLVDENL